MRFVLWDRSTSALIEYLGSIVFQYVIYRDGSLVELASTLVRQLLCFACGFDLMLWPNRISLLVGSHMVKLYVCRSLILPMHFTQDRFMSRVSRGFLLAPRFLVIASGNHIPGLYSMISVVDIHAHYNQLYCFPKTIDLVFGIHRLSIYILNDLTNVGCRFGNYIAS